MTCSIQVLIGSPCTIWRRANPLCHGHDTRKTPSIFIPTFPRFPFTFDLFVFSKYCHSFYFPPNLANITFVYYKLLPSLLDRRWFSHSFQVYFVIHYELIRSFNALDLCALCFPEYILVTSSLSTGSPRKKFRALVLHVLLIWSISFLFWTGTRAGLLAWKVSVSPIIDDWIS